jgi:hypothetical protein
VHAILRTEIEASNRTAEGDAGDWSDGPKNKLIQPAEKGIVHRPWEGRDQNRKIVMLFDLFVLLPSSASASAFTT